MEETLKKILNMDEIRGVWWWNNKNLKEFLNIPLDINTTNQLKEIFPELCGIFEKKGFKDEIGCKFEAGFLIFKKVKKGWITVWSKKDVSVALLRMEIAVILAEADSGKSKVFKKWKFW